MIRTLTSCLEMIVGNGRDDDDFRDIRISRV